MLLTFLIAYLLGSIPFGLLVGLSRGIDVRKVGSCNIGATNVLRTVGKPWGILAFALDFAKGFAGAALAPRLAALVLEAGSTNLSAYSSYSLSLVGGIAAVIGHTWPIWLRFRGGKGVATSFGMLVAIAPMQVGVAFAAWLVVLLATRFVSAASIAAAATLAIAVWLMRHTEGSATEVWVMPIAVTLLSALVILRHRANIMRLLEGTENRFKF